MEHGMAKTVRFHELGPADVLRIEELPVGEPGPGEVLIQVAAFGINRSEVQMRTGEYPLVDAQLPSGLGKEAVGFIRAIGPDVDDFVTGERVATLPCFDMSEYSVYAEQAIVPAFSLVRPPDSLPNTLAAAVWQQYLTAYGPLVLYSNLQEGDAVLITAATSSVGTGAIRMAKMLGANVIATTRSGEKAQALLDTGADHAVVTSTENLVERVHEITNGEGARVILDPISGPILEELVACASYRGAIFLYGRLDSRPTLFPLVQAMTKAVAVQGYTLWEIVNDDQIKERAVADINNWTGEGRLTPQIDRIFELDDIVEAHRYMESNQQVGKIVVRVNSPG
ncbi:MAG: zinc-dependent alcohol dehydrogenase family protein [Gammaproteobacteria bacterium]|nr:zinc-dependent alcohol dehydrogenase family protein [Chromatiales bacterium]MYE49033.1 zinc-dependent alcohol dehydrogenase family protein [Gammaproteobacteria bacterium]